MRFLFAPAEDEMSVGIAGRMLVLAAEIEIVRPLRDIHSIDAMPDTAVRRMFDSKGTFQSGAGIAMLRAERSSRANPRVRKRPVETLRIFGIHHFIGKRQFFA